MVVLVTGGMGGLGADVLVIAAGGPGGSLTGETITLRGGLGMA